jgi:hypothetical protein
MKNSLFKPEDVLEFFEKSSGVKFIDHDTGKPVLETIAENKKEEEKSDYDLWLEQQDESVQQEHEMGIL